MSIEKTDKYFEDLFKFKDSIEILDDVYNKLKALGYRVTLDQSDEKLTYKMRQSQIKKIPITAASICFIKYL